MSEITTNRKNGRGPATREMEIRRDDPLLHAMDRGPTFGGLNNCCQGSKASGG